jgi:predicted amidophosphoribosyltransferase
MGQSLDLSDPGPSIGPCFCPECEATHEKLGDWCDELLELWSGAIERWQAHPKPRRRRWAKRFMSRYAAIMDEMMKRGLR